MHYRTLFQLLGFLIFDLPTAIYRRAHHRLTGQPRLPDIFDESSRHDPP